MGGCNYFLVVCSQITVSFVRALGWEHEEGHVGTGEDGSMEQECGNRSDCFVVVCFQKKLFFFD